MKAPLPPDEARRLAALRRYQILDTEPEQEFDDITLLASHICETSIAMISLVDENRQWFKSKFGITESETSRDIAFCAHGILQADVFVVKDAQADSRFATNPLVTGNPRIRFYAGAPLLTSDGHALGMLCVNDQVPRELSVEQKAALQALSRQVVAQLELRRNVTELRHAVEQLKHAQEELIWKTAFLEAQVNSSIDGILVINQDRRMILQNQRFVDLFKMPPHIAEEAGDENRLRWVTKMIKNPEPFFEKIRQLYAHPDETSCDEIELNDGTILDRYSSPVKGKDGKYYGRIWTFRDITERKKFEAKLFQSRKMETVGKLAGGIAHEFNSIMTAIIGQSELILNDLPPGSRLIKNVTEVHQAADRAAALTRQLLAYGRKQVLQPEVLDLNTVLGGMENTLRHLAGPDVDVRLALSPGPKYVKADAGQIEQVIVNIVMNAADAMPRGGKLTLETAEAVLDQDYVKQFADLKAGEYILLAITDTGPGMSEAVKARIFEPFFTTKEVGKGTGLGLATCHGIIKQSEGHISNYSELGWGTTFKIYLPRVRLEKKEPAAPVKAPGLPRGTETLLLVEDDPVFREMAATLLGRLGYTVLRASDGLDAINLIRQPATGHIDLLFTDIVMPHMSGQELADRMQALHPAAKIIFTSAYTETAIVHQGVLNPGITLLQKPFTPSALANKVREVLDKDKTVEGRAPQ